MTHASAMHAVKELRDQLSQVVDKNHLYSREMSSLLERLGRGDCKPVEALICAKNLLDAAQGKNERSSIH